MDGMRTLAVVHSARPSDPPCCLHATCCRASVNKDFSGVVAAPVWGSSRAVLIGVGFDCTQ